jgi:TonB dependent receptor.
VDVATQLTVEQQRELYTYVGSTEPKVSGGFINTFSFDNFDLTINCNFNLGHYVRCTPSYSLTDYDRGMNTNRDILSRWTSTSPNAEFPKLLTAADGRIEEYTGFRNYHYENYFDYWVRKGDYMRVQSITLGYRFPASWNQFLRISSGRMSLEGRNLFVVGADYHNYLDPETMGNQFATPIPKQISFSLNLSF